MHPHIGARARLSLGQWAITCQCISAVACFDPSISDCLPSLDACPEGQRLIDGRCTRDGIHCSEAGPLLNVRSDPTGRCTEDGCCIDTQCSARSSDASWKLTTWLDWTNLPPAGSPLESWRDRTLVGHDARPINPDQPPVTRGLLQGPPVVRIEEGRDDGLMIDEANSDVAEGDPGASDFAWVLAFAPDCLESLGVMTVLRRDSLTPSGTTGFGLRVRRTRQLEVTSVYCGSTELECAARRVSEQALECGKPQVVALRQFTSAPPNTDAGLELRIAGTAAARVHSATSAGSLRIAPPNKLERFSGSLLALVGTEGRMPEADLRALEETLQRALQDAGLIP